MKFCQACGAELLETAVICTKCGSPVTPTKSVEAKWSTGKCVGMGFLSFFIPIVGVILGIIAVCKEPNRIMGIVMIVLSLVAIPFWNGFLSAM